MKLNNSLFFEFKKQLLEKIASVPLDEIKYLFNLVKKVKVKKKKILIFGNGAGQSIANHFSVDLTKNANIRCMSFSEGNHLTCYSNDYSFEMWIIKTIEKYYDNGDLVILISASGKSKNILDTVKFCNKNKIEYITLSGFGKNTPLNRNSKKNIFVNSKSFNIIEITHLYILIQIVDLIKGKLEYSNKI
jgi:D-sedoheptulose 7-phosphate isomerase|tara:strand:- start:366 stop:932 length:567 start_codon:yes stop_codon:yes gene_type:complete